MGWHGGMRTKLLLSRTFVDLGIFSAVINLLLLTLPLYMLQVYDRVIPAASENTLLYISIIALAAVLVLGILEAVRALYANRLAARIDTACGPQLFAAALESPRAAFGDVQPLRDLATIRSFICSRAVFFLFDLPFGPFFIAILYFIHPTLFFLTLAGALLMLGLAIANQRATRGNARKAAESLTTAMTSAQLFARNAETVRTLGMMKGAAHHWGTHFADSLRASDRLATRNASFASMSRGIRLILQIAMYGVGGYLALKGEMTAGMIFAGSMVSARALQPLDQIVGSWKQISEAAAAWKRLSQTMKLRQAEIASTVELPEPKGALRVDNLIYLLPNARDGAPPLIKRISFSVAAGETLAMIGPSQAGKSTLARLLVGAIEPRSGTVRIDDADVRNWDPEKLGRHLGYMPQEVGLFPGTIAQNIARFEPDATSEQIITAARHAEVHKMILAQPDGYETVIGPSGVRLSGGERQRIGLARAFFGNPRLVILDEPNAHLDATGEAALEKAVLNARKRGVTVIVITHRPSIAAKCDTVLVLRDGQIEHFGPAREILHRLWGVESGQKAASEETVPSPTTVRAKFGKVLRSSAG